MTKIETKRTVYLFLALTLLVTAFIFYNSFQDGETSNANSKKVEDVVEPVVDELLGEGNGVNVYAMVRKVAHFVEFAALGAAAFSLTVALKARFGKPLFGYCLFYVLAVAVTDEYIQSFSDRASTVKDILIDFGGAVFGIAVICFVLWLKQKLKGNRETV